MSLESMKRILLFFTKPLVSGTLALIGTLELLWRIPSKYFTIKIEIWILLLIVILIVLSINLWKRVKIWYYVRYYTSGTFGSSYLYEWCWIKTNCLPNIYGYYPEYIRAKDPPIVNPTIKTYDCFHHYIDDVSKLQKYIMLSLYNKVENTKETNMLIQQIHLLETNKDYL